jgi:hypothetical protein
MRTDLEHLDDVVTHLLELHECAVKMARKLMTMGDKEKAFALKLLERAFKHDSDKFKPSIWKHLRRGCDGSEEFVEAWRSHTSNNRHHPEYHSRGIHEMSDLDLAELLCDWAARASEMKTGLQQYIEEKATLRYGFSQHDPVYARLIHFKSLLCGEEFRVSQELLVKNAS